MDIAAKFIEHGFSELDVCIDEFLTEIAGGVLRYNVNYRSIKVYELVVCPYVDSISVFEFDRSITFFGFLKRLFRGSCDDCLINMHRHFMENDLKEVIDGEIIYGY